MKIRLIVRRALFLILTAVICSGSALIGKGYCVYREAVGSVSLETKVAEIQEKEVYTQYEDLPDDYINAVVAVEDKRFYIHPGIDPIAICRAVINDVKAMSFAEGGSTITQQLAKNLYFSQEKELTRKIAEMFVAFDLRGITARMRFLNFM